MAKKPTQERVKELFNYDAETGILTRKIKGGSWTESEDRKYGKIGAGRVTELGYVMVSVDAVNFNAGCVAWLYTHGEWPRRIKYLNGIKTDNRLANLSVNNRDAKEVAGKKLTQERLKELLHYEPTTGWFTWRVHTSMTPFGTRAGGLHGFGYRNIGLDYNKYLEHHLAWLYMTGEWPEFEVDHINRKRDDNRWENLCDATKSENGHNKGLHPKSTTGFPGVSRHGNRYRATITIGGTTIYLGRFRTVAETRVCRLLNEISRLGRMTTFLEERDGNLPALDGKTIRIERVVTETNCGSIESLTAYNQYGVPFFVKGDNTVKFLVEALSDEDHPMAMRYTNVPPYSNPSGW